MSFDGKIVLVTGATRGIGRAIAVRLGSQGATIVGTATSEAGAKSITEYLREANIAGSGMVLNVTDPDSIEAVVTETESTYGAPSILVNNAGIAAFGSLNDMEISQWEAIMQTNVMGMYYVTKEVLPYLIKKNEGDIINISSTAGLNGNANTSAYSASKFAVIGMSQSLMKEVRKNNIRVCTLTPSTISTDMALELGITDGNVEKVLQPEDFAELIVAGLKLPRRAMLASASLWSTNP